MSVGALRRKMVRPEPAQLNSTDGSDRTGFSLSGLDFRSSKVETARLILSREDFNRRD